MAYDPYGTVKQYSQAFAIKKHNALIQPWAAICAEEVAKAFWATWMGIEDRLPSPDNDEDSPTIKDKNKYTAVVRVEVKRYTKALTTAVQECVYRCFLAGAVEQSRDLGCLGWYFNPPVNPAKTSESSGLEESDDLGVDIDLGLNLPNPRATKYAEERAAAAVTAINDTTRKDIANIVTKGINNGDSYATVAKKIKDKFAEFAIPKPQQHIPNRAVLVAVTESANAYCSGNYDVGQMLMDSGLDMMKHWLTLEDSKVSDGCKENQKAGWIPLDKPFPSGHDHPPRFPGCRCDFLQDMLDENALGKQYGSEWEGTGEPSVAGKKEGSLAANKEYLNRPTTTGAISHNGWDGNPITVNSENDLTGKTKLYRGITGTPEQLADYHKQLLQGDWFINGGGGANYGHGMYTARSLRSAAQYAGSDGLLEKMALRSDAKIYNLPKNAYNLGWNNASAKQSLQNKVKQTLAKEYYKSYRPTGDGQYKHEQKLKDKFEEATGLSFRDTVDSIMKTPTSAAAFCGYDAVSTTTLDGEKYVIVLNRTALEVVS